MKLQKAVLRGLFVSAVAGMVGCASLPPTLVTSSSPLPGGVRGTVPAYGSDCQFFLLGFLPLTGTLDAQAALDEAKESADVDVLTDITVDYASGYFILFSNNCVRIRGKGVERRVLDSALRHSISRTNKFD